MSTCYDCADTGTILRWEGAERVRERCGCTADPARQGGVAEAAHPGGMDDAAESGASPEPGSYYDTIRDDVYLTPERFAELQRIAGVRT